MVRLWPDSEMRCRHFMLPKLGELQTRAGAVGTAERTLTSRQHTTLNNLEA